MSKAHTSIQNPCTVWGCGPRELVEIEIGARYRRLLLEATLDAGERSDEAMEAELEAHHERFGVHDLHDELTAAKAEMEQQLQLLHARRYTVEEPRQTPSGGWYFHERKARPGDLVMVPQWFVGTGRDEAEPEEERPSRERMAEERMMRSPRMDREEHGEWLTLADILDDRNAERLARAVASDERKAAVIAKVPGARPLPTSKTATALRILQTLDQRPKHREWQPSLSGTVSSMCEQRGVDWRTLLHDATTDSRKVKPKYKKGFLHLILKGIRVFVEVPEKEFVENGYRVTYWHEIPENPTEY